VLLADPPPQLKRPPLGGMTDITQAPGADSPTKKMLRAVLPEFFLWAGGIAFVDLIVDLVKGDPVSFRRVGPFIVSAITVALFGGWRRLKNRRTSSGNSA